MKISVAVAAVILVTVFLVFFNKPVVSANDLFSRYFYPMDIIIPRGSTSENFPMEITEAYENGRYSDLSLIKKEKVTFKGKNLVYLIVGISDIEMKNYSKADSDLREVSSSNEYYSYACWYLALLNIKDEEYAKAKAYLDVVKENNLNFLEKANSLLSELDKLSIHGSSKLK